MGKRFKLPFKLMPNEDYIEYLHSYVFNTEHFNKHIDLTASSLDIHRDIVYDVVTSYWIDIALVINAYHKKATKINIYGFFSLKILKGTHY